jgi:hypothetical protein
MKKLPIKTACFFMIFVMILLAISSLQVSAQKTPHEFSISGGIGFSTFCIQPPVKKATSTGFSADVALGFTGFMSPQWGVHLGLGWGLYNVNTKIKKLTTIIPDLVDKNNYAFDLHSTLNNYKETQKTMFLYVPVMLQFQTKTAPTSSLGKAKKAAFYAMAGVKTLMLFNNKYELDVESLRNAAYYPEFDNWAATQIFAGLSTFDGNKIDGKFKLSVLVMLALETGVKWQIGNTVYLYTGVYFDCGLNDPSKKLRKPFDYYTSPEQLKELTLLKFADKMNLMTVGIRLRFAFFQIPNVTSCPYH